MNMFNIQIKLNDSCGPKSSANIRSEWKLIFLFPKRQAEVGDEMCPFRSKR